MSLPTINKDNKDYYYYYYYYYYYLESIASSYNKNIFS